MFVDRQKASTFGSNSLASHSTMSVEIGFLTQVPKKSDTPQKS
jgi:hypothetical protein